jgi:molybdopterin-guanine dinucleotide biosynthesis protein A
MGGAPKGLLTRQSAPRETLIERTARIFHDLGVAPVLVGAHPAYAALGIATLADEANDQGPLGGLVALLRAAGDSFAVAVACDMPHVTPELVARLLETPERRAQHVAPALAPRRGDFWEPFFARYHAPRCLPRALAHAAEGHRSLQRLLDALSPDVLPLSPDEAASLDDWDTPEDRARRPG